MVTWWSGIMKKNYFILDKTTLKSINHDINSPRWRHCRSEAVVEISKPLKLSLRAHSLPFLASNKIQKYP